MVRVIYEGECCADCALTIANGECWGGDRDIADEVAARIAKRHPRGHCCVGDETTEFSWRQCQACGSNLGGSRHAFSVLATDDAEGSN